MWLNRWVLSLFPMKTWIKINPAAKAAVLLIIILLVCIFNLYKVTKNELMIISEWELFSIDAILISFPVLTDKFRLLFRAIIILISLNVMLFSVSYISKDKNLEYFVIIVMMFILSINILIFLPNILMLLLGWDGLGLTSYLLVIFYSNNKSLAAGIITALTNRIGDALLIVSASWTAIRRNWQLAFIPYGLTLFIITSLFFAAITKRAQLPFSAWLPAAIAAPTPVSALVHSSTLVTAGIYLLIRFYPSLSIFFYFNSTCFYIGTATCLMARLAASQETDLKKIIALSTLSQLGVIIISLGINQPILAFFHLITHALFKALLFLCAGNIIHNNSDNQDIRLIGNLALSIPFTCITLNTANLSLCGLPFLAGFYSKDLIVEIFLRTRHPLFTRVLIMTRICLTSAYTIKLSTITLWSPLKGGGIILTADKRKIRKIYYSLLVRGAIIRGSTLSWIINPMISPIVLPFFQKVLTLVIILLFAIIVFMLKTPITMFLSTIWFLTLITSSPLVKRTSLYRTVYFYNESTWIESIRVKTTKKSRKEMMVLSQKISRRTISILTSTIILIITMLLMYN